MVALGGGAATNAIMTGMLKTPPQSDAPAVGHDHIVAHPKIVTEAQQATATPGRSAADRFRQALTTNNDEIYNAPADPVHGNRKEKDHGGRLDINDYPILGPGSELASRSALAAITLGKYVEFYKTIMASS